MLRSVPNYLSRTVPLLVALLVAGAAAAADKTPPKEKEWDTPWPADVPNFKPVEPGEHPRLFFRKADIPKLRERAATPEGQGIVKRLRFLLNGGNGESLPAVFNDSKECTDRTCVKLQDPVGKAFTLWHGAGYGTLYVLTGDKKFAELARQAVDKALGGTRDRDGRYSFITPNGALRAGPAIGAIAMAYDLCYDGWDEEYRKKVALALQNYDQPNHSSLLGLVRGARLGPSSNHCGPQIGGGALLCLAIMHDPGVDMKKIGEYLEESKKAVMMQLTQGWSMYGNYCQGDGAGAISSDTAFLLGLQAWRCAGGKDYISPRPVAQWMTLKWISGTTISGGQAAAEPAPKPPPSKAKGKGKDKEEEGEGDEPPPPSSAGGKAMYPGRGMYARNCWARIGLSGGGTFSQGFGAIDDQYKPALLWLYNHYFKAADEQAGAPCDTISAYPHRCLMALVNWPLGLQEKNPGEIFPLVDQQRGIARNQWKDASDIMVCFRPSIYEPMVVQAYGTRLSFGQLPGGTFNYYKDFKDGSAVISNGKGSTYLLIDFSKASGAELLMVLVGKGAKGGKDNSLGDGVTCKFTQIKAGESTYDVRTIQKGAPPEVKADGNKVVVGGKWLYFDGEKLVVEHLNAADAKK